MSAFLYKRADVCLLSYLLSVFMSGWRFDKATIGASGDDSGNILRSALSIHWRRASRLVTAFGLHKLAINRRKDAPYCSPDPDQDGNGDDGDKSQYQGVLDKGLAFSESLLAASPFFSIHTIAQMLL